MMLSVAILARDEEKHIVAALQSAAPIADEIVVVVDPRTVDRTAAIAEASGARVCYEPFHSFSAQRNRALALCQGEWVLFLDADERITTELAHELQRFRTNDALLSDPRVGYAIPRYNLYWGRRLRGGGWYPDHQLRLVQRNATHYNERRLVHELAELDGPSGQLSGHLLHINIESWAELQRKQRAYALKEAETLWGQGVRARPHNLVLQPLREARRRFITWRGYRDGWLGLLLALVMSYYEFGKYLHLLQLGRRASRSQPYGRA